MFSKSAKNAISCVKLAINKALKIKDLRNNVVLFVFQKKAFFYSKKLQTCIGKFVIDNFQIVILISLPPHSQTVA